MSHEIINSTLPVVIKKIENVLKDYPKYPYQVAFFVPELRQKLITHVLSQILNHYTVEGVQEPLRDPKILHLSPLEERLRIQTLIHGGMLYLLRENAQLVRRYIHQLEKSDH